ADAAPAPAPRATETPRPAARRAARVRSLAGRAERNVARWNIETSGGGGRGNHPEEELASPGGDPLVTPPLIDAQTPSLRGKVVRAGSGVRLLTTSPFGTNAL